MDKNTVYLELTEHQMKKLQPLFKQTEDAYAKGMEHRGVVLGQFKETDGSAGVVFLPADQANRIVAICEEIWPQHSFEVCPLKMF